MQRLKNLGKVADVSHHVCVAMMNLFAASSCNNYAKSCEIYLQQMLDLRNGRPMLHEHFMHRNCTIRQPHRLWADLSCDLVIEQTLVKSAKDRGG